MSKLFQISLTLLLASILFGAVIDPSASQDSNVLLISSTSEAVILRCELTDLKFEISEINGQRYSSISLPGEGATCIPGKPILPAVSRFVVVPPTSNLALVINSLEPMRVRATQPPILSVLDSGLSVTQCQEGDIFPPAIAEMGEPFIVRGARMVKVTTYPIRYDTRTEEYLYYDGVETEVRTTTGEALNPVTHPIRRGRSQTFLKFLNAIAINGSNIGRDDPDRDDADRHAGHYLVVTHQNCLPYIRPFIEWKRKAGYQVDILSLSPNDANASATVQRLIQSRYDEYIENGLDPFDELLLVGDRSTYSYNPPAQWILNAPRGNTGWGAGGDHADYLYACLEGRDDFPDVGVSRWISGSQATLELAVARTLGYEATPYTDNPEWFGRAAVFSQHWGHDQSNHWHPSQHLEVRWSLELLKQTGFGNVQFYENFEWDQQGTRIGPWLRDRINERCNLMIGRAENASWRSRMEGVNDNVVFPIYLTCAQHSDMVGPTMFREGDGQHLKGVVAETFTWGELTGGPSKLACNMIWAEMVGGFIARDLPLGWARVYALTNLVGDIPDIQYNGQSIHAVLKTDFDVIGDSGIQPWIGVPRVVEAELLTPAESERRFFGVQVTDPDGNPVSDATVTFYAPGTIPDEDDDYADYDGYVIRTTTSDEDGHAQFLFDIGQEFMEGTTLYVTITGRDIRPFFLESEFSVPDEAIEVADFTVEETEGNGDGNINPGELVRIAITAQNNGQNDLTGVNATISTTSLWAAVEGENQVDFGDIASGEEANTNQAISVRIDPSCPDGILHSGSKPELQIEFAYEGGNSTTAIELDPVAPGFEFVGIVGGSVIPDTACQLDLIIMNSGRMDAPRLSALLHNQGLGVSILEGQAEFPATASGEEAQLDDNLFTVAGNHVVVPGSLHEVMLTMESEDGWRDTLRFNLQVSTPREHAPQGPDAYGYICLDDTDTDWDAAPDYNWIEINPDAEDHEFEGELLDFEGDSDYDIGESRVIPLGFQTQFYGQFYDSITVATNGFIAPGSQPGIVNFQNFPLDRGIGGGAGMIAPLWTDLRMDDNSAVYSFYDEENARTIVEWSKMRYASGNLQLTFQVILFDHDVWITETGDQNILFQYQEVEIIRNVRGGDTPWETAVPYPSIGISSPDCKTGISYAWNNEYPVTSAPIVDQRALLFSTSPRYRSCTLFGFVGDALTERPIEGAQIYTRQGFVAVTDAEGYWEIPDALAEITFDITASKQGYNDSTVFIEDGIPEDELREIDFYLLHPEFSVDRWEFRENIEGDQILETEFTLSNRGNGPLDWRVEKRLIGDFNAEPWELRRSSNVGQITGDDRIEGVVFANGRFYISGANGNDENLIYVLNRECELLDSFPQIGSSRYGYKDMDWDGENIWVAGEDSIFALTTDGEVANRWESPLRPSQYVAIDSDEGTLYISGTTSNILRMDQDGNRLGGDLNRQSLRIYGLAYWPEDPDGYNLYILHKPAGSLAIITKMNVATGDTLPVTSFDALQGATNQQSAVITNQFDIYSWVFLCIANQSDNNGGDQVEVYQLEGRKEWMDLDLWEGRVDAGESQNLTLTLNATGLPDTTFVGEMRFHHNADSGVAHIGIELTVGNAPPPRLFELLTPADGDTIYDRGYDFDEVHFIWRPYIDPAGESDVSTYLQHLSVDWESVTYAVEDTFTTIDLDSLRRYILLDGTLIWSVSAVVGEDTIPCEAPFSLHLLPLTSDGDLAIPIEFGLQSIYPSPFNACTNIRYGIERKSWTTLCAYDLLGQRVAVLNESYMEVGYHQIIWDGGHLATGIYILRLESEGKSSVRKIALLR